MAAKSKKERIRRKRRLEEWELRFGRNISTSCGYATGACHISCGIATGNCTDAGSELIACRGRG